MFNLYLFFLFDPANVREKRDESVPKPYHVFEDKILEPEIVAVTSGSFDVTHVTSPSILNVTELRYHRNRRFGAWEVDLQIPQTVEKVVTTVIDPFSLSNSIEWIPEPLLLPFFTALLVVTLLWDIVLLALVAFISYKTATILFYLVGKLTTLLCGGWKASCYRQLCHRCCFCMLTKTEAPMELV